MEIDDGVWIRFKADTSQLLSEMAKISPMVRDLGDKLKDAGVAMSAAITAPMAAIAGFGLNAFAGFEASMNRVQAMTGEAKGALKGLSDQALELGSTTQFSATKIATAMGDLASAGLNVREIYAAMPGTLDFAAAGQMKLADAAKVATQVMHEFGMNAADMGKIADTIAYAASKSSAEVSDMGVAFQYFGPIARVAGISMQQTAAAFEILADAGVRGSKAGTAMRQMISNLENPSKKAADAMRELGIQVHDAQGKLLPLDQLIQNLRPLLDDTGAGFQIFGKRFSEVVSLLEKGPEKFRQLTTEVEGASGAASKMAATLMQGFSGEWKRFLDELDSMKVKIGAALAPFAESFLKNLGEPLVKVIGSMADAFGKLPTFVQGTVIALGGLAAAAGPAVYVMGTLVEAAGRLGQAWPYVLKAFAEAQPVLSALRLQLASVTASVLEMFSGVGKLSLANGFAGLAASMRAEGTGIILAVQETFSRLPYIFLASVAGLRNTVMDTWAGIAQMATAGLAGGLSGFSSIVDKFKSTWAAAVAAMTTFISGFSVAGLVSSLQAAGTAVLGFISTLGGIALPIAGTVATVAVLAGSAKVLYDNWDSVKPVLIAVWRDLQSAATVAFAATAAFINDVFGTKLTTSIGGAWRAFTNRLKQELAEDARVFGNLASFLRMEETAKALQSLQYQLQGVGDAFGATSRKVQDSMRAQAEAAGGLVKSTAAVTTGYQQQAQAAVASLQATTLAVQRQVADTQAHAAALLLAQQRGEALKRTLESIDMSRLRAETQAWTASLSGLDADFVRLDESIRASGEHTADFSHALDGITSTAVPEFKELDSTVQQLGTVTIPRASQAASGLSRMWDDGIRTLERGISGIVLKGEDVRKTFANVGKQMLSAFLDQALHAGIKSLIGALVGVEGAVGGISKAFGSLGDTMSSVLGGGSKGAGGLAGSISGSLSGVVGMVTGIGSMISGIIGNFQNARQETTLNAIEESTRYMKSYLRDNLVPDAQKWWPYLSNTVQLIRLEGIENAIVKIAESGLGQSNLFVGMVEALQKLPPEIGQGLGEGMAAIAQAMTSQASQAFEPMLGALMDIRSLLDARLTQMVTFLQAMTQAAINTYSVLAKPGWVATGDSQRSGGGSTLPASFTSTGGGGGGGNVFNVVVNSNGSNPYTFGSQVVQGINAQMGVRV